MKETSEKNIGKRDERFKMSFLHSTVISSSSVALVSVVRASRDTIVVLINFIFRVEL